MNKVTLLGRLTKDPEMRYSQSAEPIAVTKYGIAVNRRSKREGEPDADFFNCTVFGKAAEFAEKYFKKGQMVAIVGRLQNRSWDDPQTGQKRYATDVVVEDQHFAESRASFEARAGSGAGAPRQETQSTQQFYEPDGFSAIAESIDDEELPF